MKFQQPLYEAQIVASDCAVELLVNDVFSFCNFTPGGLSLDWPINEFILRSGPQTFELRMLPYKGETALSSKAKARVNIAVREAILPGVPQEKVTEPKSLNVPESTVPVQKITGQFSAEVPYTVTGWTAGLDLRKEAPESLRAELVTWNARLLHIYKTGDIAAYREVYKDRNGEFDQFFYSTPEEIQRAGQELRHSKFKDLVALPTPPYQLCFYAGGRLASLRLPYQPPGFVFEPQTKNEDSLGITLTTLFQRKGKGSPLTIIR